MGEGLKRAKLAAMRTRHKIPRVKAEVGQVWRDCDKRMHGRTVKIMLVASQYAYARTIHPACLGKEVRIRLDRMYPHSTGWELVGAQQAEQK